MNSINGNITPVNAPKGGPPIAVIVIVILVIIGIIVGVVMATRPAPTPPATVTPPPPPVAQPPPPPIVQSSSPVPIAGKVTDSAAAVQGDGFDTNCITNILNINFGNDFPFVAEYMDFVKGFGLKTTPRGGQCPQGTIADPKNQNPSVSCQLCTPPGAQPSPPQDLQNKVQNWLAQKNKNVKEAPVPVGAKSADAMGQKIATSAPSAPAPQVAFYTECDYKGDSFTVQDAVIPDLAKFIVNGKNYNRRINSVKIPKGLKVTAYRGGNFTGDKLEMVADFSCLLKVKDPNGNWGNVISSLKVEKVK
jgi:hypothetical protein